MKCFFFTDKIFVSGLLSRSFEILLDIEVALSSRFEINGDERDFLSLSYLVFVQIEMLRGMYERTVKRPRFSDYFYFDVLFDGPC